MTSAPTLIGGLTRGTVLAHLKKVLRTGEHIDIFLTQPRADQTTPARIQRNPTVRKMRISRFEHVGFLLVGFLNMG